MYVVDLGELVADADTVTDLLNSSEGIWNGLYDQMDPEEILWVIAPNEYRDGRLWPVAMAAADYIREESPFKLKNTITVHQFSDGGGDMASAYDEILLLVKDKREYQFHKDEIRIAHVYEGNEWGGEREKGNSAYHDTEVRRYNPDGKDPGNVWLEEDRTQSPDQTVDATAPLEWDEAIRRCVLVGSRVGETVHSLWAPHIEETVAQVDREFNTLNATELRQGGA